MKTSKTKIAAALGVAALLLVFTTQARSQPTDTGVDVNEDDLLSDPRVRALLWAIRMCEHTPYDVYTGADYSTFYGGSRFSDLSDHPVRTGEKEGVTLPREMCIAAGFISGNCVSTAAGAYQFRIKTWDSMAAINPPLPDFSPASQDRAAVRLLIETGAIDPLLNNDPETAIKKASTRWASLPFSTADQRPKPLDYALAKYQEGLEIGA
jgi:muramidase (phage lysozyme)